MSDESALSIATEGSVLRVRATGEWIAQEASRLEPLTDGVADKIKGASRVELDLSGVTRLDTLGAVLIDQAREALEAKGAKVEVKPADEAQRVLLEEVSTHARLSEPPRPAYNSFVEILADIGHVIRGVGSDIIGMNAFLGELVVTIGRLFVGRARLRMPAIVTQLERMAFRGVPIISLISFLVGAIVAQQTIFQLQQFGATLFVVDLLGILMLREVGLLLAAIMVAGRSGSAITAELGSMKMREEIDAMRVMGLDPMEVLVLPRIIALIIGLPLLTFLASIAGIFGGGLVSWFYGGITPQTFLERLRDSIALNTFFVGIIKAPVMALMIGLIACIEGLKVEGSAESLGRQTTASVVKSIFTVIVVDGNLRHLLRIYPVLRMAGERQVVISAKDVKVGFGDRLILDGLSLDVFRGEILGVVGASGTGKSVLMRTIIGLAPLRAGTIEIFGEDLTRLDLRERQNIARRWGVLFQHGALFSSLNSQAEHPSAHAGISGAVPSPSRRNGHAQDRFGRAQAGCGGKISVRAFRRHDQARGARARPRPRSRYRVPRRADLGPRSHRCR